LPPGRSFSGEPAALRHSTRATSTAPLIDQTHSDRGNEGNSHRGQPPNVLLHRPSAMGWRTRIVPRRTPSSSDRGGTCKSSCSSDAAGRPRRTRQRDHRVPRDLPRHQTWSAA
jgi:hypothetical protein